MFSTEMRKKFWLFAVGALTFLLAVATLNSIFATRALSERIVSCTTPGRTCYDAGGKRTAQAVEEINLTIIYANVCSARGIEHPLAMKRCVWRLILANQKP